MLLNCDLGESGIANPIDDELIKYISIANIACGGHAGDQLSVNYYTELCVANNVKITAHISYPDRENFGRKVIQISDKDLLLSFDKQLGLFGNIKAIKPHGALYNELNVNSDLAQLFIRWCIKNSISELILSPFGIVGMLALENNISLIRESFIERGYMLDIDNNPTLIPRGQAKAEITSVADALNQYKDLTNGFIMINNERIKFHSDTACIHSDSAIALELALAIYNERK